MVPWWADVTWVLPCSHPSFPSKRPQQHSSTQALRDQQGCGAFFRCKGTRACGIRRGLHMLSHSADGHREILTLCKTAGASEGGPQQSEARTNRSKVVAPPTSARPHTHTPP
eukprot:CAMPEP_0173442126 /NCGR_PEP_ID=MMETSP1357-20121228/25477_1 /TAXON_ID=77926 /ORGANISM="Hemiselmis rufescens, Strain PCC563" /LENGTH=111 /DNA_ID=CAMNT_0014407799 /DNA_START=64 /DNA_END=396 /DNA_ORIENTATION=+